MFEHKYFKVKDDLGYFEVELSSKPEVTAWFTTKIGHQGDDSDNNRNIPDRFLEILKSKKIPPEGIVNLKQVHGNGIIAVEPTSSGKPLTGTIGISDALITNLRDIPLMIKTADCLSIQLWDESSGSIGNIHCGWRSGVKNIISLTISKMKKLYNFTPAMSHAVMMPAISQNNYQVGNDVYQAYTNKNKEMENYFDPQIDGTWNFDLRGMAEQQLIKTGVKKENIIDINLCTFKMRDLFYSYRRDGKKSGRMFAVMCKK